MRKAIIGLLFLIALALWASGAPEPLQRDTKTKALVQDALDMKGATLTLGNVTISDSAGIRTFDFGSTNGTKLGATGNKIGFLGATPIVRPSSTTDLRQALINLGLYTTGGATPLNLNGGAFTSGVISGTSETLSGNLSVTGNTTLGGTLGITGTVTGTLQGTNGAFSGTLGVTGTTTLGTANITTGNITDLDVSGDATFVDAEFAQIDTTGNANIGNRLDVVSSTALHGGLAVTGATTTQGITASGAFSGTSGAFSTTLGVTGNSTFGGTLGITGALSGSSFSFSGNGTVTGTLGVTGALSGTSGTFSSTLGVTGATTGSTASYSSTVRGLVQDKGGAGFNVKAYGALCDGTTNDTTAFTATISAAGAAPNIIVPAGDCRASMSLPDGATVTGAGPGLTTIRKPDGATGGDASTVITIPSSSSNVIIRDISLDGNRSGVGVYDNFGSNAVVFIGSSHNLLDNVEITHSVFSGIFIGDGTTPPDSNTISKCWIHHNGGALNSSGNGTGIFVGGSALATRFTVEGCVIEENHNSITQPNDSNGVNITMGTGLVLRGNYFKNNYNVGGGQIVLNATQVSVNGNVVQRTSSFGSDSTNGIEGEVQSFSFTNNVITNSVAYGINVQLTSENGNISGNYIDGGTSGIRLYGNQSDTVTDIVVATNTLTNVTGGIDLTSVNDNISIVGNDMAGATTPITVAGAQLGTMTTNIVISGNVTSSSFGRPGEIRTANNNASPVSLTTFTETTVTSLSLPKGAWDVWGTVTYNKAATTRIARTWSSLSLTAGSLDQTVGEFDQQLYGFPGTDMGGGANPTAQVPRKRIVIDATTTVYLVGLAQFDTSTMTASGKISAVKVDAIK